MGKVTWEQYKAALEIVKTYKTQWIESVSDSEEIFGMDTPFGETGSSVRLYNLLGNYFGHSFVYNELVLGHMRYIPETDFINMRGFGIKSLNELREICFKAGVEIGSSPVEKIPCMDFDSYIGKKCMIYHNGAVTWQPVRIGFVGLDRVGRKVVERKMNFYSYAIYPEVIVEDWSDLNLVVCEEG